MAETAKLEAQLLLEIGQFVRNSEKARKQNEKLGGSFKKFAALGAVSAGFLAVDKAVTRVVSSVRTAVRIANTFVEAAGVQERAVVSLSSALGRAGVQDIPAATRAFTDFAAELQRTTKFGDEATIQAASIGASFGITGEQLERTTKAAADLSTVTGVSLTSAFILLGKAAKGETSTLSRYGITIDKTLPQSEKFEAALAAINQQFGGAAQADAATYQGRVAQLQNTFGDLQEEIGGVLQPILTEVFGNSVPLIQNLTASIGDNKDAFAGLIQEGVIVFSEALQGSVRIGGFLAGAFKSIQIAGTGAFLGISEALSFLLKVQRAILLPTNLFLDALVKLGAIDTNPVRNGLAAVDEQLNVLSETARETLDEQSRDYQRLQSNISIATEKVDSFAQGVRGAAAAGREQAVANQQVSATQAQSAEVTELDAEAKKKAEEATRRFNEELKRNKEAAQAAIKSIDNFQKPNEFLNSSLRANEEALRAVRTELELAAEMQPTTQEGLIAQAQLIEDLTNKERGLRDAIVEQQAADQARTEQANANAQRVTQTFTQGFDQALKANQKLNQAFAAGVRNSIKLIVREARAFIIAEAQKAAAAQIRANSQFGVVGAAVGGAAAGVVVAAITGLLANLVGLNRGGIVPGVGNRDSVLAALTPGELVIPAPLVDDVSALLAGRGGDSLGGFQDGGMVSSGNGITRQVVFQTLALPDRARTQRWMRDVFVPADEERMEREIT